MKKRRSLGYFLGILLMLSGVALLAINPIKHYLIQQGIQLNSIHNLSREDIERNLQQNVTYNFDDIKPIDAISVIKNNINPRDLPTVGAVAVPSVGINIPIYLGVSDEGMYLGAGTLVPGQTMGESNYVLGSHNSIHEDLLFAPLDNVKLDEYIYITDLENVYQYQVFDIEVVDPYRMDILNPSETPIITLMTCDNTLENRFIVKGKLVDAQSLTSAPNNMIAPFNLSITIPE